MKQTEIDKVADERAIRLVLLAFCDDEPAMIDLVDETLTEGDVATIALIKALIGTAGAWLEIRVGDNAIPYLEGLHDYMVANHIANTE